jgi:septum formation protein
MRNGSGAYHFMTTHLPLLLASASPRRRQLISSLGLPFTLGVAPADEDAAQAHYKGPIAGLAQWTAAHETPVLLDDQVLNKPRDEAHARELLLSLRGRWHEVVTGVVVSAMIDGNLQMRGASCKTPVLMRPYSEEEVDAYIATGDPLDKAGAYGIQSAQFQPTERIAGCYLNVVGLPLCTLVDLLATFNVYPAYEGHLNSPCRWSERCQK